MLDTLLFSLPSVAAPRAGGDVAGIVFDGLVRAGIVRDFEEATKLEHD